MHLSSLICYIIFPSHRCFKETSRSFVCKNKYKKSLLISQFNSIFFLFSYSRLLSGGRKHKLLREELPIASAMRLLILRSFHFVTYAHCMYTSTQYIFLCIMWPRGLLIITEIDDLIVFFFLPSTRTLFIHGSGSSLRTLLYSVLSHTRLTWRSFHISYGSKEERSLIILSIK